MASVGKAASPQAGYEMVLRSLTDGSALKKFEEMLKAQNVSPDFAKKLCDPQSDLYQLLPIAKQKTELVSNRDGLISSINGLALANLLTELGAGRFKPDDQVDHGVGLVLKVRAGNVMKKGEIWGVLYHSKPLSDKQKAVLEGAVEMELGSGMSPKPVESRIIDVIRH